MGVTCFKVFEKASYGFATRRKNGQTDHHEKDSLKDVEKKAKDSKPDEDPPNDQKSNLLELVHGFTGSNI